MSTGLRNLGKKEKGKLYLLDTNFLVDYLLGKDEFVAKFKGFSQTQLFVSSITSCELISGAKEKDVSTMNELLDSFIVLPITDSLARKAGITRAKLRNKGFKKPLADILIGQTAIEYNLILVTGNLRDFPQLKEKNLLLAFPE